ncbi:MAG TPA: carboxypeptidase regulatory-like domain-containing protein [Longimicrobium sp.]|nr:carboxypeptidase regulatory-like domain-containing protein [Longimicrobium sp.]
MLAALLLFRAGSAPAQGTITILGTVNGPGGTPLAGARIQATNERGESGEARSDGAGGYRLTLPARGTDYVVSGEAEGINPVTRLVHAAPGAAEIRVDLPMLSRVVALRPVVVRARRLTVAAATEHVPGASGGSTSGLELQSEPLGSDPLADLLGVTPGVARTAGPGGTGISIGGEGPDQTHTTVDGGTASPGIVPREALRDVEVRTSPYDVSRGRFTGGQVDLRTQAAGNGWGGSLRLDRRDPRLQYGDAPAPLRSRTTVSALDGGAGGALIRNRLFVFGALSLRRGEGPARVLEQASAAGLRALGVSPDSLARFFSLTNAARPAVDGAGTRGSAFATGLLRLDAVLSPAQTLTVRVNGQSTRFTDDGSGWAVAGTGAELRGNGVGALATLNSSGTRVANELRLDFARGSSTSTADDPVPAGTVAITSQIGGETSLARLRFAGSPFSNARSRLGSFELADQLVATSKDRSRRFRVGGELSSEAEHALPRTSPGSFYFPTLEAVQADRPSLFTRTFDTEHRTRVTRTALFSDGRVDAGTLSLNLGLRAERAWVSTPGQVNPQLAQRFGLAPGSVPSHWWLSPRAGFSYSAHMPWNRARTTSGIHGGIGDFVGVLPLSSLTSALDETGMPGTAVLSCAGSSAPVPDWEAYRADRSSIPTTCRDGSPALASLLAPATLFTPDFSPPRVRRASLGASGVLFRGLIYMVNASLSRGVRQPVARDRNLVEAPAFTNPAEGGRAVYVPAGAIDPATGGASASASRRYGDLGLVREVSGDGRSRTVQLGASLFEIVGNSIVQVGYTWTDARERIGPLDAPGGGPASAGADAFGLAWGPSAYTPRHVMNVYLHRPFSRGRFNLGVIGRLSSGTAFTAMVGGDVNGDGAGNDRAFVFDPAGGGLSDETSREAMRGLLDDAPANVRRCLRAQLGRIAAHNSCRTPWSPSLDLNGQVQLGSRLSGDFRRRATFWVSAQNVTAGLDYLLHGPERLRGWGQLPLVDPTLLSVRGFDPASRRFVYDVNERFGRPVQGGALSRIPFALSLQVRVVVGTDQVRSAALREMRAGQDEGLTPARLRMHLVQQWTNVPAEALLQDAPRRLHLTPAQAARLQAEADSVVARREPVLRDMVELLTGGHRYDASTIHRLDQLRVQAGALRQAGADAARAVLTPGQWAALPSSLRSFPEGFTLSPPTVITGGENF